MGMMAFGSWCSAVRAHGVVSRVGHDRHFEKEGFWADVEHFDGSSGGHIALIRTGLPGFRSSPPGVPRNMH